MKSINLIAVSAVLTLSSCTFAPNNAKTTNNYFGYSGDRTNSLVGYPETHERNRFGYRHENDQEIIAKLDIIDDLERVIDQLR